MGCDVGFLSQIFKVIFYNHDIRQIYVLVYNFKFSYYIE